MAESSSAPPVSRSIFFWRSWARNLSPRAFVEQLHETDFVWMASQSSKQSCAPFDQPVSRQCPILRNRCLTCNWVMGYLTDCEVSLPPLGSAAAGYVQLVQRVAISIRLTE
jgi:hypothetical protein